MMIECTRFKSVNKKCLVGFADLYIHNWNLHIYGCSLYMKNGRRWVNFPSEEYFNKAGEKKYRYLMRFEKPSYQESFNGAAKVAIDKWCLENGISQENEESNDGFEKEKEIM